MRFGFLFMLVLWVSSAFAQIRYGVEAGVNVGAPFPKKIEKGAKGSLGLSPIFGFSAQKKLSRKIYLKGCLLFEQKRAKYETPVQYAYIVMSGDSIDGFSGVVEGKFKNQYLFLPINMMYQISRKTSAGLGLYGGYLLKGSNTGTVKNGKAGFGGNFNIPDQVFNESSNIYRFDFGTNMAVLYKINKDIHLQGQLSYGLSSVTKATENFKDKTHNIYGYLSVGYLF